MRSVFAANVCCTIGIHNDTKISYYMGKFFYKGPSIFSVCALYCKQDTRRRKNFRHYYYLDVTAQYCKFFNNSCNQNSKYHKLV